MNTTTKTRKLVYYAMVMAIIILMAVVPFLGFIQIPPVAITLIHIPVIIGTLLFGWKAGILFGLTFGVSSMLVAMTRGGASDVLFINPMVSVIPRVIFGAIIYPLYSLFSRFIGKETVRIGLTAFISSFVHSVLVITAIYIFLNLDAWSGVNAEMFQTILAWVFTVNITLEAVASTVVAIPLVKAVRSFLNRSGAGDIQ